MTLVKKIVSSALCGIIAFGGVVALTGCDTIQSSIKQGTGQSTTGSKNTKTSDRTDCYGIVQDIKGNEYATVIYMEPIDNQNLDPELAKQFLSQNNINWYQMITSDSMGTNRKEYAMVYFPASVTLTDMQTALNILSGMYNAHIMTKAEYDQYLADAPTDAVWDVQIYGTETTHYGPAAEQVTQQ